MGGAAGATPYPMDVCDHGFEEATKKLTDPLTDPLDMIPDGRAPDTRSSATARWSCR